jgi:hypothetical protein
MVLELKEEELTDLITGINELNPDKVAGILQGKEGTIDAQKSWDISLALKNMGDGVPSGLRSLRAQTAPQSLEERIARAIIRHLHPEVIQSLSGWVGHSSVTKQATRAVLQRELRRERKRKLVGALSKTGPEI